MLEGNTAEFWILVDDWLASIRNLTKTLEDGLPVLRAHLEGRKG